MDLGKWDDRSNKDKKGWLEGAVPKITLRLSVKDDLWENKTVSTHKYVRNRFDGE